MSLISEALKRQNGDSKLVLPKAILPKPVPRPTAYLVGAISCGFIVVALCLLLFAHDRRQGHLDADHEDVRLEVAKRAGYSEAMIDTMNIISHGGGLNEIINFAMAKGKTKFSSVVNPTNFYR